MKLKDAPAWVEENLGFNPGYWLIYQAHRNRDLATYKLGHRTVEVSPNALRAYFKKRERTTVH